MAKPIGLNIYIYNFGFLLLLILPANSMEEIEAQADSQLSTAGVNYWIEEKSVPWHQQETTHFKLKEPGKLLLGLCQFRQKRVAFEKSSNPHIIFYFFLSNIRPLNPQVVTSS
jgi:hypothetical protein